MRIYNEWYVNSSNVETPMLTDGTVIMCGPDMMGTRAFAQILDPAFNYASLPFAPKTWVTEGSGAALPDDAVEPDCDPVARQRRAWGNGLLAGLHLT